MWRTEAKRPKLEVNGTGLFPPSDLAGLLGSLQTLLTITGKQAEVLEVLEELGRLHSAINGPSKAESAAITAIADAQEQLQAAIVALQCDVDRFTPPSGYKPPLAGDEAFVRGLLSYAHRLSYSSSAPLDYQPGQPLYFFKPPAPQEAEMRVSQLHSFNREWESRQAVVAAQRQATAATPSQAAVPAPTTAPAPAADLASMAAQLGLDVQQLLSSMPPGWKPGDPIPLAPAPGAAAAAAAPAVAGKEEAIEAATESPAPAQQEATPGEEERAPPSAPPLLTGIFLDDFGQYDYDVSSSEEDEGSEESD